MKKILLSVFILFGMLFFPVSNALAAYVNGYYRSNGTYVNGYQRTAPDSNPYNNYGYPGNYNPNTGSITGGSASSYLNNYYNNSSGGNSGSSLPGISASGADLNSPEMIAAKAKYDAACATSTSSEPMIGGTQASNCREAVIEWLGAVSESQKKNANTPSTPSTNYNSGSSTSTSESNDEFINRIFKIIDKNNNQPENLCVSGGIPNSHQEGNLCKCDSGYFQDNNNKCVALSIENCKESFGDGAIPNYETNFCRCDTGYTVDAKGNTCVANSKKVIKNSQKNNSNKIKKIKKETPSIQKSKKQPF